MRIVTALAASAVIAIPALALQEAATEAEKPADQGTYVAPMAMTTPTAEQAPGQADTSRVEAGSYDVDPGHTIVSFTVDHLGFSSYTGQFGNPSGTLELDPANPTAAKVNVTFPVESVSTTSGGLDTHLKSADFFDAENHPNVTFVSNEVVVQGDRAAINGDLTIRGVTLPVVLQAKFYGAGMNPMSQKLNIGFRATTSIKRSAFGMKYALPAVSDEVILLIDAAFVKAG